MTVMAFGLLLCMAMPLAAAEPASVPAVSTVPAEHPRLLLHRKDLVALRVRCGIEGYQDDPVVRLHGLQFGSDREALGQLREVADLIIGRRAETDDLWAPAVMHLITGEIGQADVYSAYIAAELLDPDRRRLDLDAIVALDYCWDAIAPDQRARIAERLSTGMEPFDPGDNPLNYIAFQRRLCSLATAIVLQNDALVAHDPRQAVRVQTVLAVARTYIEGPFLRFCQQRGAVPAGGNNGPWEEASLVLAVELWRTGMNCNLWPQLGDTLGRAMEHYFYADSDYAGLEHGFIHDDGSYFPQRPATIYRGFLPAVPWAIARQTGDPVATWYANRNLTSTPAAPPPEVQRYQWVRLLYGPLNQPEAARRACPLGRNLAGGWVAMRNGWERGATVVLFDYGQPFWRARQHFDAGQFQIIRKGLLAIDSGDDVTYEAVASKGGNTTIGLDRGDWDQYYQATVAHNCVTVEDRISNLSLYGQPWLAAGNQRLIEHDYTLQNAELDETDRYTGRLTVFETNTFYTYAVADLTPAYRPDAVKLLTRRILFLRAGAMLVLDRARTTRLRAIKTWHLHLPTRPRLVGEPTGPDLLTDTAIDEATGPWELNHARQIHGVTTQAGVWELYPDEVWVEVTNGHGRLYVQTLLPDSVRRRLIGGPMEPRKIFAGSLEGHTYYGGDPLGYEHRLLSTFHLRGPNAAYALGRPSNLGPDFGVGSTWGRLDVSPLEESDDVTFLHLLIPTDKIVGLPPLARFEKRADMAAIDIRLIDQEVHVELNLGDEPAGKVVCREDATRKILFEKELAITVTPNGPIPGSSDGPLRPVTK